MKMSTSPVLRIPAKNIFRVSVGLWISPGKTICYNRLNLYLRLHQNNQTKRD